VNTVVAGVSFFIFMRRWKRRGVFGALRGSSISQEDAAPVAP
jgi:hypothetical protein